jgi:hypothetical protein
VGLGFEVENGAVAAVVLSRVQDRDILFVLAVARGYENLLRGCH